MSADVIWQPFREALRRLSGQGRTVDFWLRDDDAVEPTAALELLLKSTGEDNIPLSLAVIPEFTGQSLADRLTSEGGVSVTVHGWSHHNHAPPQRKKQELGPDRPAEVVGKELHNGFDKLQALYPRQFVPVLVPPWNRIDAVFLPALPELGFKALSVYGKAKAVGPIRAVNTHVDIMDWHGTGGCLPHEAVVAMLVRELDDRADSDEPIGILTHHLVHDASAWKLLAHLFEEGRSSVICWKALGELLN